MPDGVNKGSRTGYNAQIALVDSGSQVIVAAEVTQGRTTKTIAADDRADRGESGTENREGHADTATSGEANVTDEQVKDVDLYVANGPGQARRREEIDEQRSAALPVVAERDARKR